VRLRRSIYAPIAFFLAAAGASAQVPAKSAEPLKVASAISAVTVFSDRALVRRTAELRVQAGETTLVFTDLPAAIDPASLQVSGSGLFTLRDVRVTTRQLSRDVSAERKALEDERRAYEASIAIESDRVREAEAERTFVDNMAKRVTSAASEDEKAPLDTAAWARMLDFYRGRYQALNLAVREAKASITTLQAEVDRVNRELRALGGGSGLSVVEAELSLEAQAPTTARLVLSYLVSGPSWMPDYVVRADSAGGKLSLHYRATVRQGTGEDWSGVALSLSTARPQVGGSAPELEPWYIDVYKPPVSYRASAKESKAMAAPAPAAVAQDELFEAAAEAPAMGYAGSVASVGATAVTFTVPGATIVASDNRERTVTVAMLELPVSYSYAAVPKLSPHAYFRAEATNDSDYPLLAGRSHVYVDGGYVADSAIGAVPPGGSFSADLGVDEAVSVERKLVKKFDETTGVVSKKQKTTWQYAISVKNGKKAAIRLVVTDQLPISANEQIVVKGLEPAWSKDTATLAKVEGERFVWTLELGAGQEARLPLSFSVEYPKGTPIVGLE